jgi:hypothetical protein
LKPRLVMPWFLQKLPAGTEVRIIGLPSIAAGRGDSNSGWSENRFRSTVDSDLVLGYSHELENLPVWDFFGNRNWVLTSSNPVPSRH